MKRLVLLGLFLSACTPSAPLKPYGSDVLPLDANGLPPHYSLCVRNRALRTAAIYDVYFACHRELIEYAAELNGVSQEQKAALVDGMEGKAMDYAQQQVVDRHGEAAVRAALMGQSPPPRAANRPVAPAAPLPQPAQPHPERPVIVERQKAPPMELRF